MFNTLKRQFIFHRRATVLLILCYMISILFISVGTSYLQEVRTITLDNNLGDIDKILSIDVRYTKGTKDLVKYLMDEKGYDIKVSTTIKIDDKEIKVYGHNINSEVIWKPNALEGNYLLGSKGVAVGKGLNSILTKQSKEKSIRLGENKYNVVGIVGRKNRPVAWNDSLFMSLKDFYDNSSMIINETGDLNILYLSKKVIDENERQTVMNQLKAHFPQMEFINESADGSDHKLMDTFKGYIVFFSLILIVSIVNITALSIFWIMDKAKEIGLRKAVGFTNIDIIIIFLKEMFSIGVTAVVLSLIAQIAINIIVSNVLSLDLIINDYNILSAIVLVITIILITSIIPVKSILKVSIKEIINN